MAPPPDLVARKVYWLLGPDGQRYESATPGTLGGNAKDKIYGRLDCGSALAAIRKYGDAYTKHRVFFADEDAAVAAGYRPCGNCMRDRFVAWKRAHEVTHPKANDLKWWRRSHIAKPAENTATTDVGYEVAMDLGLGEKTNVWQLPLHDGEVLRLLFDPQGTISDGSRSDLRDALSDAFDGLDVTLLASEPMTGMKVRPTSLVASFSIPKASSTSLDAFDLLGVSHREDSYTTLIGRAFTYDAGFRSALLHALGQSATTAADWACRLRVGVTSGADEKNVPDIVFFSREARELIIVEAKIEAGERDGQTNRYAEPGARAKLCSRLSVEAPEDHQRGLFLTLDGTAPKSSWFRPVKWTVVAEAAEASTHPGTVGLLLRELAARVREHDAWPVPEPKIPVLRYLRRRPGLITGAVVFHRLLDAVRMQEEGFLTNFSHTANPGCGYIPLCQWDKPSWERPRSGSDPGLSVHFELQWNTATDELRIYLHCETNPYLSKSELQAKHGAAAPEKHAAIQDELFAELERRRKALEAAGWTLRRGYNMLASHKFPRFIRAEAFHAKVRDLVQIMAAAVDAWAKQASLSSRG